MSATGQAARELEKDSGIKSTTIHSLLNRLEKEAGNRDREEDFANKKTWNLDGLKPGDKPEVWVVDEAGLTSNNLLLQVQQAAIAKQAKVVLVGDYKQMPAIGAGNSFQNMVQSKKISTCYLTKIIRQKDNKQLLKSVYNAVSGNTDRSLALVADSTQVMPCAAKRFKAITTEYTSLSAAEQANTIILTARNKDRIAINNLVRQELVKKGVLEEGQAITIQTGKAPEVSRNFAASDKIMFFENNYHLGVMNGESAVVKKIDGDMMEVESNGKQIQINLKEYNHFDHAYAVTTYKSQGITVNRVIINLDSSQKMLNSRNAFYVDISRARHKVSIYVDDMEKISKQISQFFKKLTSDDFYKKNTQVDIPETPAKISRISTPKIAPTQKITAPKVALPKLPIPAINILTTAITAPIKLTTKLATTVVEKTIKLSQPNNNNRRGRHI